MVTRNIVEMSVVEGAGVLEAMVVVVEEENKNTGPW